MTQLASRAAGRNTLSVLQLARGRAQVRERELKSTQQAESPELEVAQLSCFCSCSLSSPPRLWQSQRAPTVPRRPAALRSALDEEARASARAAVARAQSATAAQTPPAVPALSLAQAAARSTQAVEGARTQAVVVEEAQQQSGHTPARTRARRGTSAGRRGPASPPPAGTPAAVLAAAGRTGRAGPAVDMELAAARRLGAALAVARCTRRWGSTRGSRAPQAPVAAAVRGTLHVGSDSPRARAARWWMLQVARVRRRRRGQRLWSRAPSLRRAPSSLSFLPWASVIAVSKNVDGRTGDAGSGSRMLPPRPHVTFLSRSGRAGAPSTTLELPEPVEHCYSSTILRPLRRVRLPDPHLRTSASPDRTHEDFGCSVTRRFTCSTFPRGAGDTKSAPRAQAESLGNLSLLCSGALGGAHFVQLLRSRPPHPSCCR